MTTERGKANSPRRTLWIPREGGCISAFLFGLPIWKEVDLGASAPETNRSTCYRSLAQGED